MRALLFATLARAETAARLGAILGPDLKVLDTEDQLVSEIAEADALFIGDMFYRGKIADAVLQHGGKLRWMQVLTAGYDNAKQIGVPPGVVVTNVGDALAPAVGLHAVSLLLTLQRQVPAFVKNQEKHGWDRSAAAKLAIPLGATVAVLGFGHIGREIARILRALGAHVIGVSRTGAADPGADEMVTIAKLEEILPRADAIMLALPLDAATQKLMGEREFALCKRNAVLVNIARGGIVDQIALANALANGTIAGAGLDVTEPEPLPPEHPLWDAPNLYISPHCAGGAGKVSTERIAGAAADNLTRFMRGEPLQNVVKL